MIKNKRGQFYLIGAVLIIFVIVEFMAIQNYARGDERKARIYEIKQELKEETAAIYNYGIVNGYSDQNVNNNFNDLIEDWLKSYTNYKDKNGKIEWIFVYGKRDNLKYLVKNIGGEVRINNADVVETGDIVLQEGESKIEIMKDGREYEFEADESQERENFFFVIKQGDYLAIQG